MDSPWLQDSYSLVETVRPLFLKVDGERFTVLINPDLGSWIALSAEEYEHLKKSELTTVEWEGLFLRGIAKKIKGDKVVKLEFPKPAEYPSLFIINITTKCNLNCKYCFANSGPSGSDMSEEVMIETIKQALQMPEISKVIFEFQGGEPTINFKGIKRFIELSEEINKSFGKSISYRIETNGTLINDEMAKFFYEHRIEIGVSIDGPAEINDATRVYQNGKGTFEEIMKGVRALRNAGYKVLGSVCTINKYNVEHPKEIVEFFKKENFSFKPRPTNILGREKENHTAPDPEKWFEAYKTMYFYSKELGVDNSSAHIYEENTYTPFRDYMCLRSPCGAAREVVSINPNGDVYPCDGFKGVEEFKMGNILNEKIVDMLKKPFIVKLRNRTWKDIPRCNSCVFHGMCGSCVYSAYGAFGDIYREDPECLARKKIFLFLIENWIRENMLKKTAVKNNVSAPNTTH